MLTPTPVTPLRPHHTPALCSYPYALLAPSFGAGKLEFPRHFEPHARDLVRKLLTADRTKRIGNLKNGAEDIKKHKCALH